MYIIPKPLKVITREEEFLLNYQTKIVAETGILTSGLLPLKILQQCICEQVGLELPIIAGEGREGDIVFRYKVEVEGLKQNKQEYELNVLETGVLIEGSDAAGILYGVQTLCQIIKQCGGILPCMQVFDRPDILNRGYYLDETRGRVLRLEELKKFADRMCQYKLNQLQLYVEHTYLFKDLSEVWRDAEPLTAQEILELDCYCAERQIELVPSLASFGHLYQLLSTKSYGELCEIDSTKQPVFSFWDRMRYHTINVSEGRSINLIKKMIKEYMQLFSSNKFNICADETFCLGKGKSKHLADEKGVHRIYIDFVKQLCEFLVEHGKIPMFWGDIISHEPELIKELPKETICLNWGYAPEQREDETIALEKVGATQYLCPGVCGWNQWVNLLWDSYQNITRMCGYARGHGGIGVLNTDWGDFGHVNDPKFSVPGMIYGAAFSWSAESMEFEEINRQISRLEYADTSESYVGLLAKVSDCSIFHWREAVMYYEEQALKQTLEDWEELFRGVTETTIEQAHSKIKTLKRDLLVCVNCMKKQDSFSMQLLSVILDGIELWNQVGLYISQTKAMHVEHGYELAERLENWFHSYKNEWRKTSKEGDLHHIANIVFWYADLMRTK